MEESKKLISFDLLGDFGFFRKPDYNDGILLSFNMLHKPALLGILGAIIGLKGYQRKGEFPEYYERLNNISVGIEPLEGSHERGNFQKTTVKYTNTVGYANQDGNLLIEEVMLIEPAYRCYLLLDTQNEHHNQIYQNLKAGYAEYIPYLGKNEFQAWWLDENGESTFIEYEFEEFAYTQDFQVRTVFRKTSVIKDKQIVLKPSFRTRGNVQRLGTFSYFERLPHGFNEELFQYDFFDFAYSDWIFAMDSNIESLYRIFHPDGRSSVIHLFA